ncbi:unnamed protein product [Rhizoctonia solani]|uniref:Uncharacterized protein n=1 Tax=Rhizoctonia solani TaxID=456999 RepID=A0A8H3DC79_9AGAM|nr:unnamed protein product [Rhizoctonia solani]
MSEKYYASTFHYSGSSGDSVKVKFNGTAVYIYGAKRPNRGHYTINQMGTIDFFDRFVRVYDENLNDQPHEITLTNDSHEGDGRPFVDVDYVNWTSSVDSHAGTNDYDDGHPNWSYNGMWDKRILDPTNNQTAHSTRTSSFGSSAILTFQGDAVYLYGAVARGHGSYNVTLDNREPIALNGFYTRLYPNTILYFADGLGPGSHTLVAKNTENKVLGIDFARVFQSKDSPGTPAPPNAPGPGRIIIATVCGVLVLFLLAVAIWYIRRKRQNKLDVTNLINPTGEIREMPPPGYEPASAGPGWYIQELIPRRSTRPGRKERRM